MQTGSTKNARLLALMVTKKYHSTKIAEIVYISPLDGLKIDDGIMADIRRKTISIALVMRAYTAYSPGGVTIPTR